MSLELSKEEEIADAHAEDAFNCKEQEQPEIRGVISNMEFGKKANENVENGLLAPDEIVTAVLLGHFPVGSNINAHQQSSRDSDLAFSRCIHQWTSQTITSITDEKEQRTQRRVSMRDATLFWMSSLFDNVDTERRRTKETRQDEERSRVSLTISFRGFRRRRRHETLVSSREKRLLRLETLLIYSTNIVK
ncbi:hypothetical protein MRB53_031277 [Persea americana]|uniref:Uncharacterized protein n=1 Tax=Persea americana TaxID=3435 RepID=A0ACC2KNM0_PERAE|nr:hypothetical protein MRB53_031277 [Persea americana]